MDGTVPRGFQPVGKGKREHGRGTTLTYGTGPETVHSALIPLVRIWTWSHRTAKESEKCSLFGSYIPYYNSVTVEEGRYVVGWIISHLHYTG